MSYSFAFGVYFINNKSLPSRMMGDAAAIARIKIKGNALENIGYYTENQKIEIKVRKEIEDKMNNALENKEFIMYLQPKYSISEKTIIGAEAEPCGLRCAEADAGPGGAVCPAGAAGALHGAEPAAIRHSGGRRGVCHPGLRQQYPAGADDGSGWGRPGGGAGLFPAERWRKAPENLYFCR